MSFTAYTRKTNISEETAKTFASASSDDQKKATEIAYICLYSHNQSDSDINRVTYVSAHAFVGSASSSVDHRTQMGNHNSHKVDSHHMVIDHKSHLTIDIYFRTFDLTRQWINDNDEQ